MAAPTEGNLGSPDLDLLGLRKHIRGAWSSVWLYLGEDGPEDFFCDCL